MKLSSYITVVYFLVGFLMHAQHHITINATLDPENKSLYIVQEIVYKNNSDIALSELYLNDWANSFSSKTTPLAKRFAENYISSFHFENEKDRGKTDIISIVNENSVSLNWDREEAVDIIKVDLDHPLQPGDSYTIKIVYNVTLPNVKFTRYGVTNDNDYKLKYWYLSPAVFDGKWHAYSNKNTLDLYLTPSTFDITFQIPVEYTVISDFDMISETISERIKTIILKGEKRIISKIQLLQHSTFESIVTDKVEVITNLENKKVSSSISAVFIDRVIHFLDENLGPYPFKKIVISEADYKNSPVYGLNQLPNFISPFPDGFEYDLEQLKTISRTYIENTLFFNPRNDYWLTGALQIYLMMEYVNTYYPNMKIIGGISNFWVIRWAHASKMEFNDQYPFLYLNMARNNLNQSLTTPKDSLVKFNKNIASDYYAGTGLQYLSDYLGKEVVLVSIKEFYSENNLKPVHSSVFQKNLENHTNLPVNWFFEDYINSRSHIDFKIKKVIVRGDSLEVQIKNKRNNTLPVSLYGLNKDQIIFKQWILPIDSITTVTVASKNVRKLALNFEAIIPEYNQRNNYKNIKGLLNRPIQFRLFQDIEDPKYNQIFFMPIFRYNFYDGFALGPKIYNKTILPKAIHYNIEPQYGFKSKTIIGKASLIYTNRIENGKLYYMRFGVSGNYFSYNKGLFYKRYSPYMIFAFRNKDLRNNEKRFINIRNVNVYRDPNPEEPNQEPNYNVFNVQYVYFNPNLINYFRGAFDYQLSSKFSKVSTTLEYRKLFLNNRQINIRLYAGLFLYNKTDINDDFFSFALDRPTDYLFDYNYYGRSEDTGLFSQQLIISEGGFKSQIEPSFSNSWITTVNASTNIWKWIYAYGDVGLIHNKKQGINAVFDSGVRLSFVADYFELYFPLYSTLGWEPGQANYDQKIRFIVTLDLQTLSGLFTRKWY